MLAVLLAAFLVSKSCGAVGDEISQEQAVTIAKAQVDYKPERVMVFTVGKMPRTRSAPPVPTSAVPRAHGCTTVIVSGVVALTLRPSGAPPKGEVGDPTKP